MIETAAREGGLYRGIEVTKSMLNTLARIYQAAERANYETFEALGRFDNPDYAQQQAAHDATGETYRLAREALINACIEFANDEVDEGHYLFKRLRNPTSPESIQFNLKIEPPPGKAANLGELK